MALKTILCTKKYLTSHSLKIPIVIWMKRLTLISKFKFEGCKCVWVHEWIIVVPLQCGKLFFSNTRQNGEWTEISTRQNEIELAMIGEWHFFLNSPTICNKYQINNTVMFNNLFGRYWQVINLVKKDQHSHRED
jgi:hypothetical protein